ncbi:TetR/AcrR family transcriptional regulator [Planomonospora venezuelensis]|uniref:AcrR family transcriptional regulator n=1 Tax=Planomonospora venezuelensis TaxID=1999 RepID=A0A841D8P2_PLAVE|nr:AcrR family transcriptional regulator [Planomonospora venezuelensis]GIM62327.1 TetR family transcriptional regulator [Planomonospora venezuelensis]
MSRSARPGTRREILEAAAGLFAAGGFRGTSLQDIATAVGCSKAALLYHFDGKDTILSELLAPAVAAFRELDARLAVLDDRAVRLAAVEGFVDLVLRFRREVVILYHDIQDLLRSMAFAGVQEMTDRLLDALAGRSPEPEARTAALLVLGGVPAACAASGGLEGSGIRGDLVRSAARALGLPAD